MDDEFIFMVDDWDTERVRIGTQKAINDLKFIVLYEVSLKPGYWNGVYVTH